MRGGGGKAGERAEERHTPGQRQSGRSAKPRHGTVALHGRAFDLARHAASVAAPDEKPMSAA